MLSAVHRSGVIIAHRRQHPGHFVGSHTAPNPGSIDDNTAPSFAFAHFFCHCIGEIRIIHRIRAIRSTIIHLVTLFLEVGFQGLFERKASMISAHRYYPVYSQRL